MNFPSKYQLSGQQTKIATEGCSSLQRLQDIIAAHNVLHEVNRKIIHVTCLAHGISRVSEQVRVKYPHVNALISTVKNIF